MITFRQTLRIVLCLSAVLLRPWIGAAQETPKLFVDGVVFAGIESQSHTESSVYDGPDLGGTVPGGTVGVGTYLNPRVSLRFEASFLGANEIEFPGPIYPYDILPTLPQTPVIGGPTAILIMPTAEFREEQSSQSYSLMGAYHQGNTGRIRVSYMAGPAFLRVRQRSFRSFAIPASPPLLTRPIVENYDSAFIYYVPAIIIGADVEIGFGSHVKVLPQVRVVGTDGSLSVRPGVGLRWTM